jgi:hypothetical protein
MSDLKWSEREKKIARRVFDQAVANDLNGVLEQMKQRAAAAKAPADMWGLKRFLEREQRRIDTTYDFRYSVLAQVLTRLVIEGKLRFEDLAELGEDKREVVRQGIEVCRALSREPHPDVTRPSTTDT